MGGKAIIERVSVGGAIIESTGTTFKTDAIKSKFALTWKNGWFMSEQWASYDACRGHATIFFPLHPPNLRLF